VVAEFPRRFIRGMGIRTKDSEGANGQSSRPARRCVESTFGEPRCFLGHRLVYLAISQRAHGLTVGINLNPGRECNFNCVYCEVRRNRISQAKGVNLKTLDLALRSALEHAMQGDLTSVPAFQTVPRELMHFQGVAVSGDGEPTLCPNFSAALQILVHLRSVIPFFKIVVMTNGSGLHLPPVQEGFQRLAMTDEVWVKLDAGTQEYMNTINRTSVPLSRILENLLLLGRQRPLVIQSLFPCLHEQEPPPDEIDQYVQRLADLRDAGAAIQRVLLCSAHQPTAVEGCGHLPLQALAQIARKIKANAGLEAEVF
jgi:wyosine [tRNA(Phe)-imidazoG37] synthetase (radical SAM superfamily)